MDCRRFDVLIQKYHINIDRPVVQEQTETTCLSCDYRKTLCCALLQCCIVIFTSAAFRLSSSAARSAAILFSSTSRSFLRRSCITPIDIVQYSKQRFNTKASRTIITSSTSQLSTLLPPCIRHQPFTSVKQSVTDHLLITDKRNSCTTVLIKPRRSLSQLRSVYCYLTFASLMCLLS